MSDDLKPCPFCGGEAEFVEGADDDGTWVAVVCPDCGAGSRQHYPVMDDARPHAKSAWNARALSLPQPTVDREVIARLKEAEELLTLLIAYDDEAGPNGLLDAVDQSRQPYQSAAMAGLITHARAWLPGNSLADRLALYRKEREQAGLPASSTALLNPQTLKVGSEGGGRG